ncbi:MAG: DegV family protein [Candidatus Paceibacterota bacterium]|jgi:DegV family protein with EDD domain
MKPIGIITESTADLPLETIQKNRIGIVSVKLDWPDVEILFGENTFQKMREAERRGIKSFGKTSQPSPKDYLDCYKNYLAEFEEIICISLSSKLSGGYNSAIQAKSFLDQEDQKRIFNVDSLNISAGQGLMVLKALEEIKKGKNSKDTVLELKKAAKRLKFFVILEDYKWLQASGRISRLAGVILKRMAKAGLRPLIGIKNGKLFPAGIKTKVKDFSNALFEQLKKEVKDKRISSKEIRIAIVHGDDLLEAKKLEKKIKEEFLEAKIIFLNLADDVIGIVAGPGALAVAWLENE